MHCHSTPMLKGIPMTSRRNSCIFGYECRHRVWDPVAHQAKGDISRRSGIRQQSHSPAIITARTGFQQSNYFRRGRQQSQPSHHHCECHGMLGKNADGSWESSSCGGDGAKDSFWALKGQKQSECPCICGRAGLFSVT
jgi:hypothetical protein